MSKRDKFLDAARSQVNKGIYVWGGNGENLLTMSDPEAWIRKKETSKENANRAINLFHEREEQGVAPIQAFDCSGLIYWAQKEAGVGYGDKTANGYWKECEPVENLQAGDLVFHHNGVKCTHVGIYNGDGYVIESYGRDKGVILNKRVDNTYWNRQGRLKKLKSDYGMLGDVNLDGQITPADAALILQYLDGLKELNEDQKRNADVNLDGKVTKEDAELIMQHIVGLQNVKVIGGSVYVRSVDHVPADKKENKESILGVAHKGDTFPYRATAPSGWYEIDYKGKIGYISNRSDLTTLI